MIEEDIWVIICGPVAKEVKSCLHKQAHPQ